MVNYKTYKNNKLFDKLKAKIFKINSSMEVVTINNLLIDIP